jgi:alpha-L-fucosidase
MKAQLRELLTGYGPIGILWFDNGGGFGGYDMGEVMHGQELVDLVHQLQPDCLVNNRAGVPGDYGTPEQEIPPGVIKTPWEACMTINRHWGYNKNDNEWKSAESLIRNLIDITSKGGNYLLNVGPTAEGVIPAPEADRLEEIGRWMKVNGEAVYGAGPTPFGEELGTFSDTEKDAGGKPAFLPGRKWRFTTKPGKLYVILYQWPDGPLELPLMKPKVKRAVLLAAPAMPLELTIQNGRNYIRLPAEAPDKVASVIALDLVTRD